MRPRLDSCYVKVVGKNEWRRSWILLVSLHVPVMRSFCRVKAAVIQTAQNAKRRISLQMAELMTRRRCNVSTSWIYLCAASVMNQSWDFCPIALFTISETSVLEFIQSAFLSNLCIVCQRLKEEMDRRMCWAFHLQLKY